MEALVELEPVVVAGTSASEAARGGGLKAQASVKHRLRTAAGLPRTARTAGVCLGPPPHSSAMVLLLAFASC